jgi:hypothetical protein
MKSPHPELEQKLDELADGLDAGWDMPDDAPLSLTPHSAPLPAALDELDADWDVPAPAKSPALSPTLPQARVAQARASAVRPSQARPDPTRAITPPVPPGAAPTHPTKRERREAERKRRAHEAQQKSATKKQRKAARREQARLASEQSRLAEEQASAERRSREAGTSTKRAQAPSGKAADGERSKSPKRVPKRVRHEHTRSTRGAVAESVEKSKPAPVIPVERGAKKLILPLLIAILVAVTLGFALSRAR